MTAFDPERARHNMIEQQIRHWEVMDQRVLDTLQATPREAFVPGGYRGLGGKNWQTVSAKQSRLQLAIREK